MSAGSRYLSQHFFLLLSPEVTPGGRIYQSAFGKQLERPRTWQSYIFQLCCRFAPGLSVTEAAALDAVVAGI